MYAHQALPTIRFEDMGGRSYELPAQTDCWPAPADLRADAPAPVIVSADEGGTTLIYACSDGCYRPLKQRREWLAEQVKDALVLALVPASKTGASKTGALVGYVRGVAGSDRALPLLPARPEPPQWQVTQVVGYAWMIAPLNDHAREVRRTDTLVGRYGWASDEVPPTRDAQPIAEVGEASMVISERIDPPTVPKGWRVWPHVPPRPRFEVEAPDLRVIAVAPEAPRVREVGHAAQQRWSFAVARRSPSPDAPRGRPPTIVATGRQE